MADRVVGFDIENSSLLNLILRFKAGDIRLLNMRILLLIDANSLIHRCFHALPPLTAPDGRPTQALYGLANILLKIFPVGGESALARKEEKPDYAAALFDRPEPTFRKDEYKEYKAQRPKAPAELVSQIIEAHNLFEKFGVKTFEKAGFEADDFIATFVKKFGDKPDLKIVILTGDLDTLQLVKGDKVVVRVFRKGISDTFIYNEQAVLDRYGLMPNQMTDYKALVGDPSDNIKGVPGVGPKTASDLLSKFENIEGIYNNLESDEKLKKKLGPFRERVELSKKLVTLVSETPLEVSLDDLKVVSKNEELKDYFRNLGFESLLKRIGGASSPSIKSGLSKNKRGRASRGLFDSKKSEEVLLLLPNSQFKEDYLSPKIKIGFELKKLIKNLWEGGRDLLPPYFDLSVAFWLLEPDFKNYEPEEVFKNFLSKEWSGTAANIEEAYDFCKKKIDEFELSDVFNNIEMPLLRILAEMEKNGIGISLDKLELLREKIEKRLDELGKEIYKLAGEEFNINSPKQLREILFQKLGIGKKFVKKTEGGQFSTSAENLKAISSLHPIVNLILEYRDGFKILSTYVIPIKNFVGKDGRLRTEFNQTGTATGRLSSETPNLQTIPQESFWAKDLRSAFEARKEFSFVSFDYSQLELRILAALSEDPRMMEAFKENIDIHKITASRVLGIPLEKVGEKERRLAKTLNFGLIYGMGITAFSEVAGISRSEAEVFAANYFREFSRVKEWQEEVKNQARSLGYVKTLTGRRRYVKNILSRSPREVSFFERAAINHPIQGLGADIIKLATIKTREALGEKWNNGVELVLSVHDELLFEIRDDMIKEVAPLIKEAMEKAYSLSVPLVVEVACGKDLSRLEKVTNY